MPDVIYHISFADGRAVVVNAAPETGGDAAPLPDWTRLDHHRCANCTLPPDTTHCPMAVQFRKVIDTMGPLCSYDKVTVRVHTPERIVTKATTVQRAVGSLMGLLAANSACPRVAFLKPMAHFHLPFATEEETIYRVASMYLLGQYFQRGQGGSPDWELSGLTDNYRELQQVNAGMAARLRTVCQGDGTMNALILLDMLAKALPYSIDDALEDVKRHFCGD